MKDIIIVIVVILLVWLSSPYWLPPITNSIQNELLEQEIQKELRQQKLDSLQKIKQQLK